MSIEERKTTQVIEASKINVESLLKGNLAGLTDDQIFEYYAAVCNDIGVNYRTKPFDIIETKDKNGAVKKSLYANKECAAQLRKKHKLRVKIISEENIGNAIYKVKAYATSPNGDEDEDIGTANITGLRGDYLADAMMKAVTRAKRRVILSISGLGTSDEPDMEYTTPPQAPERQSFSIEKAKPQSAVIEDKIETSQPAPTFEKIEIKPQVEEIEFSFGDPEPKKETSKPEIKKEESTVKWSADKVEIITPEEKKEKKKKKSTSKADLPKAYQNENLDFMNKEPELEQPAPYKMMKITQKELQTQEIFDKIKDDWFCSISVMDSQDSVIEDGNIIAYREVIELLAPNSTIEIETRFADICSNPDALGDLLAAIYREAIGGIIKDEKKLEDIDFNFMKNILSEIEQLEKYCKMLSGSESKTRETFIEYNEQYGLNWSIKKMAWAYRYATSRGLF